MKHGLESVEFWVIGRSFSVAIALLRVGHPIHMYISDTEIIQ